MALAQGIELRGVCFAYGKELEPVLEAIDLSIAAGKITAVMGSSGAGKSTLTDLLIGLIVPDRGEILVDGQRLDRQLLPRWRRSVGYVPQDSFLFHDTIRSNLLWAQPDASEEEIWEALRMGAADRLVSDLDEGLDTIVGDRGEPAFGWRKAAAGSGKGPFGSADTAFAG